MLPVLNSTLPSLSKHPQEVCQRLFLSVRAKSFCKERFLVVEKLQLKERCTGKPGTGLTETASSLAKHPCLYATFSTTNWLICSLHPSLGGNCQRMMADSACGTAVPASGGSFLTYFHVVPR